MKQQQIKSELKKTLKKLQDIEFAVNEASIVAITDHTGKINFVNDKFCDITKYSKEELIGQDHNLINSHFHSEDFFKEMWKTIGSGQVWKGEIRNKAKDGTYYWVDTTIVPFLNDNNKPYQYISIRNDITSRKQMEEKIKQLAYYDSLTGLPNRYFLNEYLNEKFTSLKDDGHLAILFLDIDRFKAINDTFGRQTGDLLLKQISERISSCLSHSSFISRQGGDEFVIVLDHVSKKEEIAAIAQKLCQSLSSPLYLNNAKIITAASIGISFHSLQTLQTSLKKATIQDMIDAFLKEADAAMYQVKEQGGNHYLFNTPDLNKTQLRKVELERELRYALEKHEFSIVYQPQVQLGDGNIFGAETLLRWNNHKLGSVPPAEFIPILEETGLIIPVGLWVLKNACKQVKQWHDEGIELSSISVNVSPRQFKDRQFVKNIEQILMDTKLTPSTLDLEITESIIQDMEETNEILQQLRKIGVRVSIDDFGTGYSSLMYLKQLPIDNLKIDKSFLNDISNGGEVIVKTIIDMGRNLNFTIIAEGIENKEQSSILHQYNCHFGQGYYYSKPVEAEEIKHLLTKNYAEIT